jgi:glycosyltransferase involved in cell wall biosynthesis
LRTAHISVVIPAFNEERRIRETIREVADYFSSQDEYALREIVVVDDGSSDDTYRLIEESKVTVDRLVAVRHVANQGKGEAIRSGVLHCSGDLILFTDVDLSTPLRETGRLFEKIKDGFDVAIASRGLGESRLVIKQPAYREMSGRLFNLFVQVLFLPGIWDTHSAGSSCSQPKPAGGCLRLRRSKVLPSTLSSSTWHESWVTASRKSRWSGVTTPTQGYG